MFNNQEWYIYIYLKVVASYIKKDNFFLTQLVLQVLTQLANEYVRKKLEVLTKSCIFFYSYSYHFK